MGGVGDVVVEEWRGRGFDRGRDLPSIPSLRILLTLFDVSRLGR